MRNSIASKAKKQSLPDTRQATRRWHERGYQQYNPAHVAAALACHGERLAEDAIKISAPDIEGLAALLNLPVETVLNIFGADIISATIQSMTGDPGCIVRQKDEIRRYCTRSAPLISSVPPAAAFSRVA